MDGVIGIRAAGPVLISEPILISEIVASVAIRIVP
jgi:hypothetical protein